MKKSLLAVSLVGAMLFCASTSFAQAAHPHHRHHHHHKHHHHIKH